MRSFLPEAIRRRPRMMAVVLGGLLLVTAAIGFHFQALHHWHDARRALRERRAEEAREHLRFCLLRWPDDEEVLSLSARAARLCGDVQEAESTLKKLLKLQKGASEAVQLEFLLIRVQTGEGDAVAPTLLAWVDNDHADSALILETLARYYTHHLRFRPAYACLSRWIEVAPEDPLPCQWRGTVQERLNNPRQAMQDYQRALDLDPDLLPARLRIANLLLEENLPLEAVPHLERLYQQDPDRPEVLASLGQCRLAQGDLEEARRHLEAAVKELPKNPPLLVNLAKLELQDGRPREAEIWARRLLASDPHDAAALYTLFDSLRIQGREEEAAAAMKQHEETRALLKQANDLLKEEATKPSRGPSVPSEAGALLLRLGQERLGLYWLFQALERDPTHAPSHKALADYYEKTGEPERAAAHRGGTRQDPKHGP